MTLVDALQAALAVEHQAVYGYGVIGGRTARALQQRAEQSLDEHRLRRDALSRELQSRHVTPTPAAVGYQLPFPVDSSTAAARLAVDLENATAGATWDLVAASAANSSVRRDAVDWLSRTTARLSGWQFLAGGDAVVALPGQPG